MHLIPLNDSVVVLFESPLTIHKHHPFYHRILNSSSLEEVSQILETKYSRLYCLHFHDSKPLILPHADSGLGLVAVFITEEECYTTYPELFI